MSKPGFIYLIYLQDAFDDSTFRLGSSKYKNAIHDKTQNDKLALIVKCDDYVNVENNIISQFNQKYKKNAKHGDDCFIGSHKELVADIVRISSGKAQFIANTEMLEYERKWKSSRINNENDEEIREQRVYALGRFLKALNSNEIHSIESALYQLEIYEKYDYGMINTFVERFMEADFEDLFAIGGILGS